MKQLNTQWVRQQFPGLSTDFAFFDNAGGTQIAKQVVDLMQDYLYHTNVQLGATYTFSQQASERINHSQDLWTQAINANDTSEIILGSSSTALLQNLSRSLVQQFKPGDEVIVTNADHEANIGPWMEMKKSGIIVKIWNVNPNTFLLDLEDLEKLMTSKTRLVAFTHVSNILGTIFPIKEITQFVHERGALVCADGVAFAPHRAINVKEWDVDFYVFSLYKVYGPHYSLLFGKKEILAKLPGTNHYFIGNDDIPYKLQPGNVNYELTYGSTGILSYFKSLYSQHFQNSTPDLYHQIEQIFSLIGQHEESLTQPLIEWINNHNQLKIIGAPTADRQTRVPTISFTVKNTKSSEIPPLVDLHRMGIRWGDFYAKRLIEDLQLDNKDGVIRVSLVHYNTLEEVQQLIEVLDKII